MDLVQQKVINTDDFFVLLCIAKRVGKNKTSFPSRETLMQETNFGKTKVSACITSLCSSNLISKKQREVKNKDGKKVFSSNEYKITNKFLSIFVECENEVLEESCATVFEDTQVEDTQNQPLSINQSSVSINQSLEVKNIKKENSKSNNFEEIKKINVEAIEEFKTNILENLNEFDAECKKRESKLKTQILDKEVAQNFIESNTQKIIDWIENKAKRSSLSDQPNPKTRFFDWVKRDIFSCYSYPPKPSYQANSSPPNNPNKPKIPNFVINKITL